MKLFKRSCWLFLGILMLGLLAVSPASAESKQSVKSVKIVSAEDSGFDAAIDATGDVEYKVSSFDNPPRIMISFPGLPFSDIVAKEIVNKGNVRNVRAFYMRPGQLNAVIFDLNQPASYEVAKTAGVIKINSKTAKAVGAKAGKAAAKSVKAPAVKKDTSAKDKARAEAKAKKAAARKAKAEAKAKAKAEKAAKKEAERKAKAEAKKAKAEAKAKAKAEKARKKEEARLAREKADAEVKAKKEAARKAEAEEKEKLEAKKAEEAKAARLAEEKADAEAKAKKEAARKAKAEAEAKAKAEKAAKKEAERKAKAEAKKAKAEARAKAKADKAAKKEEARLAKEKAKADKIRAKEEKAKAAKAEAAIMPIPAPSIFQQEDIKKEVVNNLELTLDDCIKIGVRHNRKLKIALEEVVLAKLKVDEAKRGLYPKFILKSEILSGETTAKFDGGHYGGEIQIPLYTGGKLSNTLKQSKVNLAVSLMNFKKEKNEFVLGIQQAYLTLASAAQRAQLKDKLASDADATLEEMKKRHEIGTVRDLELLDLQVQHVDIMAEVDTSRDDVELAVTALVNVLGINDDSKIGVVGFPDVKKVTVEYDSILKIALENRPEVRINELLVDFHQYGVEIAKSEGRLQADFSGSYGYGDEYFRTEGTDYQPEWFFGVKVGKTLGLHNLENNFISQDKVPASGQTTSTKFWNNTTQLTLFANNSMITVKEAKIKYQKAVDEQKNSLDSLAADVRKAYFEYVRSLRSLDTFELKMKYGQKEVEIIKAQKDINQAVSSDVLKAQSHFLNTQSERVKARENALTAAFKLNKELGVTGYIDPVAGKLNKDKIPSKDVDFSTAEAEIAWYKFWSSAKDEEKRWLARYPEIVEATDLITDEGFKPTSGWNFDYNHDYDLVAIDEPLTPAQLEEKAEQERKELDKKQAQEKKEAAKRAKEEAKRKKAEQKAQKREADKLAKQKAEAEKAEKREAERLAKEQAKIEKAKKREEARKAKAELKAKAKAEKAAKKEAERKARLEAKKAKAEAKAKAKAEKAKKREAERLAKEQAKAKKKAAEQAAKKEAEQK